MNKLKRYFGIALDPIHIGAGGYRLGGVDNTIVREPATDVPKIPGTSIAGVIREFATIYKMENDDECKNKPNYEEKRKCAEEMVKPYFGDENRQGMLRFFDSQIIFFPVSSIQGTVWITTKELLEYWLSDVKDKNGEELKIPNEIKDRAYTIKGIESSKPLNLGWLLLEIENIADGKEIVLPPKLNEFLKRIVIVSDKLFSHIVNDNLEERTSVRIDPTTGTAAEGALFTYEAIPRGTIFGFEVVIDTRKDDNTYIDQLIEATFPYLKLLGIGGLGTRGFGRMEVFTINDEQKAGGDSNAQS
jgi:CRISPR-associated protein Cmr4